MMLSFTATITAAPSTPGTSTYNIFLNTTEDQATEWQINWGDGSGTDTYMASSEPGGVFPSNFEAPHTFGSSGTYNITATASTASDGPLTASLGLSTSFGDTISGSLRTGMTQFGDSYDVDYGTGPIAVDLDSSSAYYGYIYAGFTYKNSPFSIQTEIVRFTPSGQVDTGWGSSGVLVLSSFSGSTGADEPYGIAVSPDGSSVGIVGGTYSGNWDVALVNTASGGSVTWQDYGSHAGVGRAVIFDSDGTTLDVAGDDSSEMAVAKYNLSDGSLDSGFGSSGIKRITNPMYVTAYADSLVETPSGNLIIGGVMTYGSDADFALAEMSSGGSLDSSFGSSGLLRTNIGYIDNGHTLSNDRLTNIFLVNDPSGAGQNVIAVGGTIATSHSDETVALTECSADTGTLNTGYGPYDNGTVIGAVDDPSGATLGAGALGATGQVIITGREVDDGVLTMFAYDGNGFTDDSFGYDGSVVANYGTASSPQSTQGQAAAIGSDNSIIVSAETGYSEALGLLSFLPTNRVSVGNGTISGNIFYDVNSDGIEQSTEPTAASVPVEAFDNMGRVVGMGVTDSSGAYTLSNLPISGIFSIEAVPPDSAAYAIPVVSTTGSLGSGGSQTYDLPIGRLLAAPYGLTATYNGSTEVDLSWTSQTDGNETGFHIEESVNGGSFSVVSSTASGVTTAAITGLSSTTDYVFRVAAYDVNGDSGYSNSADAAAPPPTDLMVGMDGANTTATLDWDDSSAPSGTTYDVYYGSGDDTPTTLLTSGLTSTTYADTTLTAGETRTYRVIAHYPEPVGFSVNPSASSDSTTGTMPTGIHTEDWYGIVWLRTDGVISPPYGVTTGNTFVEVHPTTPSLSSVTLQCAYLTYSANLSQFGAGSAYLDLNSSEILDTSPDGFANVSAVFNKCAAVTGCAYMSGYCADICSCLTILCPAPTQANGLIAGVVTFQFSI